MIGIKCGIGALAFLLSSASGAVNIAESPAAPSPCVSDAAGYASESTLIENRFLAGEYAVTMRLSIPAQWDYAIREAEAEAPDWGIHILPDGGEASLISVYGQYGTLNVSGFYPDEPAEFSTTAGMTGLRYIREYETPDGEKIVEQDIVFPRMDSGSYGVCIRMPQEVYDAYAQDIEHLLYSVEIAEEPKNP